MPVTGSPTQQGLDGTQVNRKRGNKAKTPRNTRLGRMRSRWLKSLTIPFFRTVGEHVATGRYGRKIILPTVDYTESLALVLKARQRTIKALPGSLDRDNPAVIRWYDADVKPEATTKEKTVRSRNTVSQSAPNPQCDLLGGAAESVSSDGWRVKSIEKRRLSRRGRFTVNCTLTNGKWSKMVTLHNVLNRIDFEKTLLDVYSVAV